MKTHKPQAFVSNEATRNDTNYRMKFAFLSKETVPDYRPLDVSKIKLIQLLRNALIKRYFSYIDVTRKWKNPKDSSESKYKISTNTTEVE